MSSHVRSQIVKVNFLQNDSYHLIERRDTFASIIWVEYSTLENCCDPLYLWVISPHGAPPTYFFCLYILLYPKNIRGSHETTFPFPAICRRGNRSRRASTSTP